MNWLTPAFCSPLSIVDLAEHWRKTAYSVHADYIPPPLVVPFVCDSLANPVYASKGQTSVVIHAVKSEMPSNVSSVPLKPKLPEHHL